MLTSLSHFSFAREIGDDVVGQQSAPLPGQCYGRPCCGGGIKQGLGNTVCEVCWISMPCFGKKRLTLSRDTKSIKDGIFFRKIALAIGRDSHCFAKKIVNPMECAVAGAAYYGASIGTLGPHLGAALAAPMASGGGAAATAATAGVAAVAAPWVSLTAAATASVAAIACGLRWALAECVEQPCVQADQSTLPTELLQTCDVDLCRMLGNGSTAKVFWATRRSNKQVVAVKCIQKLRMSSASWQNEIAIHKAASHPNILRLQETFENDHIVALVLDLCLCDLRRLLAGGPLQEAAARLTVLPIADAVDHLHRTGIMHRDLKPENILVNSQKQLVLSDFGCSIFAPTAKGMCGTPYYAAPETFSNMEYTCHVDWWSTGALCYEVLSGKIPFVPLQAPPPCYGKALAAIVAEIRDGADKLLFPAVSAQARDFVRSLLRQNPLQRLTLHGIVKHPWMQCGHCAPARSSGSSSTSKEFGPMPWSLTEICFENSRNSSQCRAICIPPCSTASSWNRDVEWLVS
eukprot:s2313_g13.t1